MLKSDSRWSGFGLSIKTGCAVPGLVADGNPRGQADLRIEMLAELPPGDAQPLYRIAGDTLIFSAPQVAEYHIRRDRIAIAPLTGADPEWVIGLLVATALPGAVWMRSDTVLHASALRTPSGRGVAIAGPSGIGKSTVTAQWLERGAALAADDSVRLHRDGDRVIANGLTGGFHQAGEQRAFRPVDPQDRAADVELGAILALEQGDDAFVRLSPVDALTRLLANQHRPQIPAILGQREQMLAKLGFVAQRCPVYVWRRSSQMLAPAEWDMLARERLW